MNATATWTTAKGTAEHGPHEAAWMSFPSRSTVAGSEASSHQATSSQGSRASATVKRYVATRLQDDPSATHRTPCCMGTITASPASHPLASSVHQAPVCTRIPSRPSTARGALGPPPSTRSSTVRVPVGCLPQSGRTRSGASSRDGVGDQIGPSARSTRRGSVRPPTDAGSQPRYRPHSGR